MSCRLRPHGELSFEPVLRVADIASMLAIAETVLQEPCAKLHIKRSVHQPSDNTGWQAQIARRPLTRPARKPSHREGFAKFGVIRV